MDKGKGKGREAEPSSTAASSSRAGGGSNATMGVDVASSTTQKPRHNNVRHGRGPLIRDSDDDMAIDEQNNSRRRGLDHDRDQDLDESARLSADSARDEAELSAPLHDGANSDRRRLMPSPGSVVPSSSDKLKRRRGDPTDQSQPQHEPPRRHRSRPALRAREIVCYLLGILAFTFLLTLAIAHLWIGHLVSEQSKKGDLQQMVQRGLIVRGPAAVRFTDGDSLNGSAFVLELDLFAGVDVREMIGWDDKEHANNWFRRSEDRMASWVTRRLDTVTVDVGRIAIREPYKIELYRGDDVRTSNDSALVVLDRLSTLLIPLTYTRDSSRRGEEPRLGSVALELPVVLPNPDDLKVAAHKIWAHRKYDFEVQFDDVSVDFGGSHVSGLFGAIMRRISGRLNIPTVSHQLAGNVPSIPIASDPTSFIEVVSYDFAEQPGSDPNTTVMGLIARARLTNPLSNATEQGLIPAFEWGMPFRLPLDVLLPTPPATVPPLAPVAQYTDRDEGILLAKVEVAPFHFAVGQETSEVFLSGHLIRADSHNNRSDQHKELSRALSRFLARYLDGKKNQVLIGYDTKANKRSSGDDKLAPYPPSAFAGLVEDMTVPLTVSGSQGKMQLFKNLKIEDMKIKLSGMYRQLAHAASIWGSGAGDEQEGDLLCSGRVIGEIDLPPQFKKVERTLDVSGIWPDVYIYDGDLPQASRLRRRDQVIFGANDLVGQEIEVKASRYPPTPTPANAFARLHPSSLIVASTIRVPANRTHNATTLISATFTDAPLFVLAGRGDVFRRFVGKIIFGGPGAKAKAGVRGISSATLGLGGWGWIAVEGLPVEGEFWVGSGGAEAAE
ncbi:BQ2448_6154 [Microbotryum intermedium]|uniref:BQ2448_6154 protein n=1 Tax=Microbotryum intermedium TaxID=269621 RepID=A0A238FPA1_9BASI|nr:BQ2448_6154 [Microbotryum intermedium]